MAYKVVLFNNVAGQREVTVNTLNVIDGMLVKGKYRTPLSNIKYIEDLS